MYIKVEIENTPVTFNLPVLFFLPRLWWLMYISKGGESEGSRPLYIIHYPPHLYCGKDIKHCIFFKCL